MNKNGGGCSTAMGLFGIIIILLIAIGSCSGGSGSSSKYKDDLNNGLQKYNSGEKMTKDEYDAVKDFNEWKYKNEEHNYNEWDSNN